MKIHHIGYLVKKIDKARESFEKLGFTAEGECVYDEIRDINILFMVNDGYRIELIAPVSERSVVADLSKKIGVSPYHLCYYSDNIEEDMNLLREKGFVPAGEPLPAPALNGQRVVFMVSRHSGMLELYENPVSQSL